MSLCRIASSLRNLLALQALQVDLRDCMTTQACEISKIVSVARVCLVLSDGEKPARLSRFEHRNRKAGVAKLAYYMSVASRLCGNQRQPASIRERQELGDCLEGRVATFFAESRSSVIQDADVSRSEAQIEPAPACFRAHRILIDRRNTTPGSAAASWTNHPREPANRGPIL
jgi:hypothetical protein